ncbi:alpha/beta fold hydrolase [Streptosporangium sp. NPDC051022]|uniref:alpha/beta hydrolase n=1 Tax=Streptosporangium sp. NPDC051022 TaxID=3155752 RepID=UPI0034120B63
MLKRHISAALMIGTALATMAPPLPALPALPAFAGEPGGTGVAASTARSVSAAGSTSTAGSVFTAGSASTTGSVFTAGSAAKAASAGRSDATPDDGTLDDGTLDDGTLDDGTCPVVDGTAARCGEITVPLIRARPSAGTTRIAYALLPRTDTGRPAAGTIVAVPGGPGNAAIPFAEIFAKDMKALRGDHDLLLVDPRGTGASQPDDCGVPANFDLLPRDRQITEVGACGRRLGARARGYTSAELADDLDAVRERLGIGKVDLYGVSYGTYLSTVYAVRHPDRTRSVVLSGAYPLRFDTLGRPNAQAVGQALQRLCARSGGACQGDEAIGNLKRLATRLRQTPIPFEIEVSGRRQTLELDEGMLALIHFYMASSGGTPRIWTELPAAVAEAVSGDTTAIVAVAKQVGEALASPTPEALAARAQALSIVCNDYPTVWNRRSAVPGRTAAFNKALRRAEGEFGPFSARGWTAAVMDGADMCLKWPRTDGPADPGPAPDVPVLVLSGDLDTNTPVSQGRLTAAQFPAATFVEVPSAGHVPTWEETGCAARLASTFIRTGSTGDRSCLRSIPSLPVRPAH